MPRIKKKKLNEANEPLSKKIKINKVNKINSKVDKVDSKVNNINSKVNKVDTFESRLTKCVDKCNLFEENEDEKFKRTSTFKDEDEYQDSFDEIISFSKKITVREKDDIDCVMFHTENEDGLMAAYYAFKYFEDKKELLFIPTKPSSSDDKLNYRIEKYQSILKDKNLIILDLSFGKANYDFLSKTCKSIIIIDDHMRQNNTLKKYKNINAFIGNDMHCASVYTFKFFNPKINVPLDLIYIDNNDRKLQLSFINSNIYRYITVYNNFKVIHSPYLTIKFTKNDDFKKLQELLLDVSINYKSLVGKLYDEVCNNIKLQVAQNAVKKTFCGHSVYILNYNDPVLYKMVSREMFSLAERKGDVIDFVVLYGYEFLSNGYKIFVSEKHTGRAPRLTNELNNILKKYGKHHYKNGKVAKYVLNFYYPHDDKYDIWNLIS
jgi:hypothetical protein